MRGARRIFGDAKPGLMKIPDLHFRLRISGSCSLLIPVGRQLWILRDAAAGEIVAREFDLLINRARVGGAQARRVRSGWNIGRGGGTGTNLRLCAEQNAESRGGDGYGAMMSIRQEHHWFSPM